VTTLGCGLDLVLPPVVQKDLCSLHLSYPALSDFVTSTLDHLVPSLEHNNVCRRSATITVLCLLIRHFVTASVIGLYSVVRWYHAGSWALRWGVRHMAVRLVLYFFAIPSMHFMSLLMFVLAWPGVGMFQHCRKGWNLVSSIACLGASSWTIMSVIAAHVGCEGEKFRYLLSQMMSIASFLADMSRRSSPPSFIGRHSILHAILGDESSSYMKPFIILFRAVLMYWGIPCVLARNCVWPPTMAWIISFLLFRVGCSLFHLSRLLFILSIIVSQGVSSFVLLPIHASNILIDSPSLVT